MRPQSNATDRKNTPKDDSRWQGHSEFKQRMMRMIPSPVKRLARFTLGQRRYNALRNLYLHYLQCQAEEDPRYQASIKKILALKDKHKGQRCFIIGNGPSIKDTDLTLLRNEVTFGSNRIYLLFDRIGFPTRYFVSVNRLVIEQCAQDIMKLPCPKFISWHCRDLVSFTQDMMFLYSRPEVSFHTDITSGVWEGATVTYVALQVAYYLGFDKVILVGVDHSFTTQGKPHATVVSQGDDPNHFDPQYFGKGFRWQLPDLEMSELAYRMAKFHFERVGREIVDATIGGKLQVFPKVNYQSLF